MDADPPCRRIRRLKGAVAVGGLRSPAVSSAHGSLSTAAPHLLFACSRAQSISSTWQHAWPGMGLNLPKTFRIPRTASRQPRSFAGPSARSFPLGQPFPINAPTYPVCAVCPRLWRSVADSTEDATPVAGWPCRPRNVSPTSIPRGELPSADSLEPRGSSAFVVVSRPPGTSPATVRWTQR